MDSKRFYPFDMIILGYLLLLSLLILIFGRPLADYIDELSVNAVVILLILGITGFLKPSDNRTLLFFRLLYPALLFSLFYEETGGLMKLFFPGFLDAQLVAFEQNLFGIDPTIWLDRNLIRVGITEILSFSYFSYYLMLPAFLLTLFISRKYDVIRQSLVAICITFFISFLLFFLYPIEGPRYYFAGQYSNEIAGPVFRPLVNIFIDKGAVHGGCMPSSHVAIAIVIMIFGMRAFPKSRFILIPLNIGLAMGTVYGRFHYVSDVVVGAAIGIAVSWLTIRWYYRFEKQNNKIMHETTVTYVSGTI
jgi:membrane-associated phospholipid phosphatase